MKNWAAVTLMVVCGACRSGPPRRPASVPAQAAWAGAGKQGRFVVIGGREGTVWNLEVYEANGRRHATTRWRLQGFARTSLEAQEIQGFAEDAILLTDGARLVPAP